MPLPQDVVGPLTSLIIGLINLQSPPSGGQAGRFYSMVFRDLPDRSVYPDYYVVIKEPRSLNGVLDSIKRGIYSSPQAVAYDLFLIWSNAREYNLPGSIVYQDADILEHRMKKLWKERRPPLPSWKTLLRPRDLNPPKPKLVPPPPAAAPAPSPAPVAPSSAIPKMKFKLGSFGGGGGSQPPSTPSPAPGPSSAPHRPSPSPAASTPQPAFGRASSKLRIAEPAPTPPPPAAPRPAPAQSAESAAPKPSFTLKLKAPSAAAPASPTPQSPLVQQRPSPAPPKPRPPPSPQQSKSHSHAFVPTPPSRHESHSSKKRSRTDSFASTSSVKPPSSHAPAQSAQRPKAEATPAPLPAPAPAVYDNGLPALPALPPPMSKKKKLQQQQASEAAQRAMMAPLHAHYQQQHELEQVPREMPSAHVLEDPESGWMMDAGSNPRETYLGIIATIRGYTDSNGRQLATPLLTVPDPQLRPDYYELITDPIALDTIEEKVHQGAYASPEAFDRDLHRLFTVAKVFIRRDSPGPVYSDLLTLQRLYFELTKTPFRGGPRPGTIDVRNEDGSVTTLEGDRAVVGSRVTHKDKVFLNALRFKGELFQAGDWVHLMNPDDPKRPIIAQIFKVFKRPDSPQRCISVCWYTRPEETIHPASRQFYENEVFKTGNFADHSVEDFVERCMVMFVTRYIRGRPKAPTWNPAMTLYVCEHRYRDETRSFKKIKNWQSCLPEEVRKHEYTLEPHRDDGVESLVRVPSPFVRGIKGPGGLGDPTDGPEDDQIKYHVQPDGQPATAESAREANRREDERRHQQEEAAAQAAAAQAAAAAMMSSTSGLFPLLGDSANFFDSSGGGNIDANAGGVDTPMFNAPPPVELPTPAEMAVSQEAFEPLPPNIKSKFRSDAYGDLLWFTAPAAVVPAVKRPTHTLDYLYWRAMQVKKAQRTQYQQQQQQQEEA